MKQCKTNVIQHPPDVEKDIVSSHAIKFLARCALPLIQAY